jgi:3-oxoacyl-[acyl-carrier protein] reductase
MAGKTERLTGRVALVTGACGGIGRSTLERLAAEDAAVVVGDLSGYEPVAKGVREAGGRSLGAELDEPSAASARAAVEAAVAGFGLTRHLARELGPRRMRVNAVCPGPILTDMLTRSTSTERTAELATQVPIGWAGTPEDIAAVIAFLASDDAAYISGASLDANGGIFMA